METMQKTRHQQKLRCFPCQLQGQQPNDLEIRQPVTCKCDHLELLSAPPASLCRLVVQLPASPFALPSLSSCNTQKDLPT
jgi:hypothetical protein